MLRLVLPAFISAAFSLVAAEGDALGVRASTSAKGLMALVEPACAAAPGGTKIATSYSLTAKIIDGVAKGEVAVGITMRDLKASEKEKSPDLVGTAIGIDALVLTVPAANPVAGLSAAQVRSIWTGAVANWKDVGGPDLAITVVGRSKDFGANEFFCDFVKLEANAAEGGLVYREKGREPWGTVVISAPATNDLALATLRTTPGAITYFPMGPLAKYRAKGIDLKSLVLDGHEPSAEAVANGTYPLRRTMNAITKGQPDGAAKAFIGFMTSAEGQKCVVEAGFIALGR